MQNKEGTHLVLYEGFGKGEAPNLRNLNSSPTAPTEQVASNKPRPVLKIERQQQLSERDSRDYEKLQQLHTLNKRIDGEKTTPEYRQVAKAAIDRARGILKRVRYKSNQESNPPSPPP